MHYAIYLKLYLNYSLKMIYGIIISNFNNCIINESCDGKNI